jgi:Peptidase family S41
MKRRIIFSICQLVLLCLVLFGASANANDGKLNLITGHWEGSVNLNEAPINFNVDFTVNKSISATLSLPDQGSMFVPLVNVVFEFPKVSFELKESNDVTDIFEGTLENKTITGKFSKGQLLGNFTLKLINHKLQNSKSYSGGKTWEYLFTKSKLYQEIQNNRIAYSNPVNENELDSKFRNLLYHYSDFKEELPAEALLPPGSSDFNTSAVFISPHDALQEIDFLFKLIKYGYGGYQFFGGDEKFQAAKNKIDQEILTETNEGKLPLARYLAMITNHLNFIQDGHFRIGEVNLCKKYNYYTTDQYIFNEDNQGIYANINKKKHYLVTVNGQDPAAFIKLSLTKAGKIVYQLGMVSDSEDYSIDLNMVFDNNIQETAVLERQNSYYINGAVYDHYELSGIPVIQNCSLNPTPENIGTLRKFVSEANQFNKYKVVILDLRSNSGGSDSYAAAWCRHLTSNNILGDWVMGKLVTNTALKLHLNTIEANEDESTIQEMKASLKELKSTEDTTFPGWSPLYFSKGLKVNNRNFLVVLMDSYTASAGEDFIKYLRQMNQVIFIGTNTAGLLIAGNVGACQLPYSKLPVSFGTSLSPEPDLSNRDGMGYFPDIWITSNDTLNSVVKFVKNNF